MHKRKRLTDLERRRLACSQEWKCIVCYELLPAEFQIDHVVPLSEGGSNEITNLQCLCPNCHAIKTATEASERQQKKYYETTTTTSKYFNSNSSYCVAEPTRTIVTGASSNHFKSQIQLLKSLEKLKDTYIIIFDLGFTEDQRKQILSYINIHERWKLLTFDFSVYPNFMNINVNAGEYAWKSVIIANIMNRSKGLVLWLDAGCKLTSSTMWQVWKQIQSHGLYCPVSQGTLKDWTHKNTLKRMCVTQNLMKSPNRAACVVGINYTHAPTRELIERWKILCLQPHILCPVGSSRKNSRQDQAVLSVLIAQHRDRGYYKIFPRGFF